MQRAGDARALEGLRAAKLGATGHQTGHLGLGEVDLEAAKVGLRDVLDLVLLRRFRFVFFFELGIEGGGGTRGGEREGESRRGAVEQRERRGRGRKKRREEAEGGARKEGAPRTDCKAARRRTDEKEKNDRRGSMAAASRRRKTMLCRLRGLSLLSLSPLCRSARVVEINSRPLR